MKCGNIYFCIYLINCKVYFFVCVGGLGLLCGYVLLFGNVDWLKYDIFLVVFWLIFDFLGKRMRDWEKF